MAGLGITEHSGSTQVPRSFSTFRRRRAFSAFAEESLRGRPGPPGETGYSLAGTRGMKQTAGGLPVFLLPKKSKAWHYGDAEVPDGTLDALRDTEASSCANLSGQMPSQLNFLAWPELIAKIGNCSPTAVGPASARAPASCRALLVTEGRKADVRRLACFPADAVFIGTV